MLAYIHDSITYIYAISHAYMRTNIHIYTLKYTQMHAKIHAHIRIYMLIQMHTYAHTSVHTQAANTQIYMYLIHASIYRFSYRSI